MVQISKSQINKSIHWSISALWYKLSPPYNLLLCFDDKYRIIVLEFTMLPSGVYKRGNVGIGDKFFN